MMQRDLISIIVPVYNMEQYLDRCVASILHQTYTNLEIILVDDGSSDSSPSMCDEYARQDSRIKVIHKRNGGLSDARNAGLSVATGSYIGYVDSDDWIEPNMYERMYKACIQNDAQIAVCKYKAVFKDRTIDKGSDETVVLSREELLNIYIFEHKKYVIYNSVWSKLFKRELVEDMLFPVGRNSEDIMYTTKAFCRVNKAVYIDECLYNYVLDRDGSIMNEKNVDRMFDDEIPFWQEHIDCIRSLVSDEMGDKAAYRFYRRLLFYYIDLKSDKRNKNYAGKIVKELRNCGQDIKRIYKKSYIPKGDKIRMKTMLMCPSLYYALVVLYDKFIIPIKSKK